MTATSCTRLDRREFEPLTEVAVERLMLALSRARKETRRAFGTLWFYVVAAIGGAIAVVLGGGPLLSLGVALGILVTFLAWYFVLALRPPTASVIPLSGPQGTTFFVSFSPLPANRTGWWVKIIPRGYVDVQEGRVATDPDGSYSVKVGTGDTFAGLVHARVVYDGVKAEVRFEVEGKLQPYPGEFSAGNSIPAVGPVKGNFRLLFTELRDGLLTMTVLLPDGSIASVGEVGVARCDDGTLRVLYYPLSVGIHRIRVTGGTVTREIALTATN